IVFRGWALGWFLAVCAPDSLEGACVRVKNDQAPGSPIAIGNVELVRLRIDIHVRGLPPEVGAVVARLLPRLQWVAQLQEKLSIRGEFQNPPEVLAADTADPDVALVVDEEPVLLRRPVIPGARSAPRPNDLTLRIEFNNRRRRDAAFSAWRIRGREFL